MKYLKPFDGIRGIAILLVLFYQFTKIEGSDGLTKWIVQISNLGFIGMDLFFWMLNLKALNYTFVFTRMDSFLIGALLMFIIRDGKKISSYIHGIILVSFLGITMFSHGLKPSGMMMQTAGYTIVAFLFFSLIYLSITTNGFIQDRILSKGILLFSENTATLNT